VVNLNASPYYEGRLAERERMLATRAADASCALAYVNQVGGQDELVFDGSSLVFDASGGLVARARQFVDEVVTVDLDVQPVFRKRLLDPRGRAHATPLPVVDITRSGTAVPRSRSVDAPVAGLDAQGDGPAADLSSIAPLLEPDAEVYQALVLGTRDYVAKNGFTDVVIGLSGGIDSSIVAAIATDALGPGRVHGVAMPSRYSSGHSESDAAGLAANLGIEVRTIAIEPGHAALLDMLAPSFEGREADLTEENLQSRIRGLLLMALSNKFGWLVLTTGNKSEMAVGYSTLYGDTAGGFAPIKDVLKTRVYDLCEWRNTQAGTDVIPRGVLDKPPSAELRPDQRDADSLPPYDELDAVLRPYIERDSTAADLLAAGFDADLVHRVTRLVDLAEYKRRQTPPGVRVTAKAFGKDRRLPITNGYRG